MTGLVAILGALYGEWSRQRLTRQTKDLESRLDRQKEEFARQQTAQRQRFEGEQLQQKAGFDRDLAAHKSLFDSQLAELQASLRARVESELKYQESHLRVTAEVQLRMHAIQMENLVACQKVLALAGFHLDRFMLYLAQNMNNVATEKLPAAQEIFANAIATAWLAPLPHRAAILAFAEHSMIVASLLEDELETSGRTNVDAYVEKRNENERLAIAALDAWNAELTNAHEAIIRRLLGARTDRDG